MGTRHLIAVIKDGQPKIAQYGQWDGYPSAAGVTVLDFVRSLDAGYGVRKRFDAALARCRFARDQAELEALAANVAYRDYYLSRDVGGEILDKVLSATDEIVLCDSYEFASTSLWCEWAYVIDLDQDQLEVYKGFHEGPAPDGERFAVFNDKAKENASAVRTQYGPVRLAKIYPFDALPSNSIFLADLTDEEEDVVVE